MMTSSLVKATVTLTKDTTVGKALELMKSTSQSKFVPIVGEDGSLIGQFNQSKCLEKILSGDCTKSSLVSECSDSTVKQICSGTSIGKAARIIQNNDYVFVVDGGCYRRTIYHSDILDYIQSQ